MKLFLLVALAINSIVVNGLFGYRITTRKVFRSCLHAVETNQVEDFLKETYPSFERLLSLNDDVWKKVRESNMGYTFFAPNESVFEALGKEKLAQIADPRNDEVAMKLGAYHCINEAVSAEELYNSGGVITLSGTVPVERSTKGGFFGIGASEDGGVTIQGAKLIQSFEVAGGIIHEMDDFISPNVLWRYIDQLRIPGSK